MDRGHPVPVDDNMVEAAEGCAIFAMKRFEEEVPEYKIYDPGIRREADRDKGFNRRYTETTKI